MHQTSRFQNAPPQAFSVCQLHDNGSSNFQRVSLGRTTLVLRFLEVNRIQVWMVVMVLSKYLQFTLLLLCAKL